jgi:quinol-cytochrome oxidoreductase complex cytochrome b subunit
MLVGHKSVTGHLFNTHACEFDRVPFGYAAMVKDIYGMFFILLICGSGILLSTKALMHPDNYLYAMAYVTPVHIEPEWYFLPYYGLLRSVPHKLLGVCALVMGVVVLAVLAILSSYDHCASMMHRALLVSYLLNFIYLGYFAVFPVAFPYVDIALLLV